VRTNPPDIAPNLPDVLPDVAPIRLPVRVDFRPLADIHRLSRDHRPTTSYARTRNRSQARQRGLNARKKGKAGGFAVDEVKIERNGLGGISDPCTSLGLMHKTVVGAVDRRTGGGKMPEVSSYRRAATNPGRKFEQSQEAQKRSLNCARGNPDRAMRSA
jgi:hypothetical protein